MSIIGQSDLLSAGIKGELILWHEIMPMLHFANTKLILRLVNATKGVFSSFLRFRLEIRNLDAFF